ncbi:membrane bound O-acyl transferase family-domain-containing protein [Plectosphaerella cucumerina]|uniref:Membrane bound O-acyl transferase family-domain-containing protein n=1 Tax=Plectosphaerella cucumerina TaxID=40658 RepID=A0A8K0WZY4_9PEZI|nr:membrane bound O-acyl transferase family-domain-containing protein [Plectosphaerella cucumerina]
MSALLTNLSWRAATPQLCFAASTSLTTIALHFSPRLQRRIFLTPVVILAFLAVLSIDGHRTAWGPSGLDSVTGLIACFYTLAAPLVLGVHQHSVLRELQNSAVGPKENQKLPSPECHPVFTRPTRQTLAAAWRIWNNPRALRFNNTIPFRNPLSRLQRARFASRRMGKLLLILVLDTFLLQPLFNAIDEGNLLHHYAPSQESLFRRLAIGDPSLYDTHALTLRTSTTFWWIWGNYASLEVGHAILSIVGVGVLCLDEPEDWPPLYGSLTEAYTLRRFWGRFWHSCMAPSAWEWSCRACGLLGLRGKSANRDALAALGVFLVSGCAHGLVALRKGEGAPGKDIMFFMANYVLVIFERFVGGCAVAILRGSRARCMLESAKLMRLLRVCGYTWVFFCLFWLSPKWLYPKFYLLSVQSESLVAP